MGGRNDGCSNAFLYRLLGCAERGRLTGPVANVDNHSVYVDPMNKPITLTQAEFDALPDHRTPPGREVATRWKLQSPSTGSGDTGGKWWYAEYIEIGAGVIEIRILEIEVVG